MYRIAEFARLAGVTVRTLQYYDRIGLLKPSHVSDSGHRYYERGDLLRLQQIVTLKWMGFRLKQIKTLLNSSDLQQSLQLQKAAVDRQIQRLQEASAALQRAIDAAEEELDTVTIHTIIHAVTRRDELDWVREQYSETAWAGLMLRGLNAGQEQMEKWQGMWADLIADFKHLRDRPPDDPAVQQLAARMYTLVERFTGGDPEARAGIERVQAQRERIPAAYRVHDDDLHHFMQQAFTIYCEKRDS